MLLLPSLAGCLLHQMPHQMPHQASAPQQPVAQMLIADSSAVDAGVRLGLSYQFGTQTNRVGVSSGAYVRNNPSNTEAYVSWSSYKNFSSIETNASGRESQLSVGLTQAFGADLGPRDNYDWSLGANNTERQNSVSLYSTVYRDTYDTSQRLAGINVNFSDFNLRFENDYDPLALLGDDKDRYRTGALELGYRLSGNTRLVSGVSLFTGDPKEGGRISPANWTGGGDRGAYSMVQADGTPVTARDRSTGNLYIGVRGVSLGENDVSEVLGTDNLQIRVGVSSDRIRSATQNTLHNIFDDPHVPLRDTQVKPYIQVGTNHGQTLYP